MIEKTVTFEDLNGVSKTETHCFHLNKAEFTKWLTTEGDYTFDQVIQRIIDSKNGLEMINVVDDVIHRSYGEKSLDGRIFLKSEEAWNSFKQSEAYAELFNELLTDWEKCLEFLIGVMPKDVAASVREEMKKDPDKLQNKLKELAGR